MKALNLRPFLRVPSCPLWLTVLGDLVPSLLKLRKQRDLALLQPAAPHHPPEISLRRPAANVTTMRIIDSQHIFRRSRLYHQDDVGILSVVHHREFAPRLDCILDATNGGAVVGQQVGIELIAIVGRYVYEAGVGQSTRHRRSFSRCGAAQRGQCKTQQYHCKDVFLHMIISTNTDAVGGTEDASCGRPAHMTGGTPIPIAARTRMSSRRTTATVASRNLFRPSSASLRIG